MSKATGVRAQFGLSGGGAIRAQDCSRKNFGNHTLSLGLALQENSSVFAS